MSSRDERAATEEFTRRYVAARSEVSTAVELEVLGSDYGANGYTTRAEADELGRRLALSAADDLLDLGAGRGWPGVYLAETTGCRVVSTDLPVEGLHDATARADRAGIADRCAAVAASGRALPFRRRSFDAIVHTDVLC